MQSTYYTFRTENYSDPILETKVVRTPIEAVKYLKYHLGFMQVKGKPNCWKTQTNSEKEYIINIVSVTF